MGLQTSNDNQLYRTKIDEEQMNYMIKNEYLKLLYEFSHIDIETIVIYDEYCYIDYINKLAPTMFNDMWNLINTLRMFDSKVIDSQVIVRYNTSDGNYFIPLSSKTYDYSHFNLKDLKSNAYMILDKYDTIGNFYTLLNIIIRKHELKKDNTVENNRDVLLISNSTLFGCLKLKNSISLSSSIEDYLKFKVIPKDVIEIIFRSTLDVMHIIIKKIQKLNMIKNNLKTTSQDINTEINCNNVQIEEIKKKIKIKNVPIQNYEECIKMNDELYDLNQKLINLVKKKDELDYIKRRNEIDICFNEQGIQINKSLIELFTNICKNASKFCDIDVETLKQIECFNNVELYDENEQKMDEDEQTMSEIQPLLEHL